MNKLEKIETIRQKCMVVKWGEYYLDAEDIDTRQSYVCRLADVLLAMNGLRHDGSYTISDAGIFSHFKAKGALIDQALKVFRCSWNLRTDDLTQQSDECIDFLYDLFCPS
jgi:hypothetical protein